MNYDGDRRQMERLALSKRELFVPYTFSGPPKAAKLTPEGPRETVPLSDLKIGMEQGGSDRILKFLNNK